MGSTYTKHGLSENDWKFLQNQTGQDRNTLIKQYADFNEACPNGKLTLGDFIIAYKKLYTIEHGVEYCKHLFGVFDKDNNGFI